MLPMLNRWLTWCLLACYRWCKYEALCDLCHCRAYCLWKVTRLSLNIVASTWWKIIRTCCILPMAACFLGRLAEWQYLSRCLDTLCEQLVWWYNGQANTLDSQPSLPSFECCHEAHRRMVYLEAERRNVQLATQFLQLSGSVFLELSIGLGVFALHQEPSTPTTNTTVLPCKVQP